MALTKEKKQQVVDEVSDILKTSKLTVIARYSGTSVKSLQQLRREAKESGTQIRVIKNRLFKKILESSDGFSQIDTELLNGQLLYAFNDSDEVAPAQSLAAFAKQEPQIEFVGALTNDGQLMTADDVKALASLPSKDQLRGQLVGTIAAPLSGFANVLAANIRGVMNVLNARAEKI